MAKRMAHTSPRKKKNGGRLWKLDSCMMTLILVCECLGLKASINLELEEAKSAYSGNLRLRCRFHYIRAIRLPVPSFIAPRRDRLTPKRCAGRASGRQARC